MKSLVLNSGVTPEGRFVWGLHSPEVKAHNFRKSAAIMALGTRADGTVVDNRANFPTGHLPPQPADPIYEIPNAFPFRGRTYIIKPQADTRAGDLTTIGLPPPPEMSFSDWLGQTLGRAPAPKEGQTPLATLPAPLQLAVAATSTDPNDLTTLAHVACEFEMDGSRRRPQGLRMTVSCGRPPRPVIRQRELFKVLINNPCLPDDYKVAMVLRPGIQGTSPIVGEMGPGAEESHVYEYLRHNSYIPWGHYAANMADDSIRYRIETLTQADVNAMRRLYYQRTYVRMAATLGIAVKAIHRPLSTAELEQLREAVNTSLAGVGDPRGLAYNNTLWGWNLGFGYTPTGYRLHASHQQVHQQYALVPATVPRVAEPAGPEPETGTMAAFHCGELIHQFCREYRRITGTAFFEAYLAAIAGNRRTDGNPDGPQSLVVWATSRVMLLVPKAQTSQWELHLMAIAPVGNILEADADLRRDLDRGLWMGVRVLSALGARMVTTIEYSKRFRGGATDQRLMYALLPKMPYSPGSFTEAQMRWINGHYPEDFAQACRQRLAAQRATEGQSPSSNGSAGGINTDLT